MISKFLWIPQFYLVILHIILVCPMMLDFFFYSSKVTQRKATGIKLRDEGRIMFFIKKRKQRKEGKRNGHRTEREEGWKRRDQPPVSQAGAPHLLLRDAMLPRVRLPNAARFPSATQGEGSVGLATSKPWEEQMGAGRRCIAWRRRAPVLPAWMPSVWAARAADPQTRSPAGPPIRFVFPGTRGTVAKWATGLAWENILQMCVLHWKTNPDPRCPQCVEGTRSLALPERTSLLINTDGTSLISSFLEDAFWNPHRHF